MKELLCTVLTVIFCFGSVIGSKAGIIYVKGDGAGPGDGLTWATAFTNVQKGINLAASGDQVWVAKGLYFERVTLKDAVQLYGGFAGTETDLSQRNWKTNASILDGSQAGTVVTFPSGVGSGATIDGFTIQNGKAANGGGIYCGSNAVPVLANNHLIQNAATGKGGGIYCDSSSPIITNNIMLQNFSASSGGGIHAGPNSSPLVVNNRFLDNYCVAVQPAPAKGGGIMCEGLSRHRIINNYFVGNYVLAFRNYKAITFGAAIYCVGGLPGNGNEGIIANNTIIENNSTYGAGIYLEYGNVIVANNIIAHNHSGVRSALSSAGLVLRNNCVYGNTTNEISGLPSPFGTNGNISLDPLLSGSGTYKDVHLQVGSPCIDAGYNAVGQAGWSDLDGFPRIAGTNVDIGADEWDGTVHSVVPRVVRVSPLGDDLNDGSSWALAKRTIAGALKEADAWLEIWLQSRVYTGNNNLRAFTYLYGGFNGTETNRDQRNWKLNTTVLDGELKDGVVSMAFAGPGGAVDGLTIKNGKFFGAGVSCISSSPLLVNNVITNCLNGGIYCYNASPIISNNLIVGNIAQNGGGGIYCETNSNPYIANNIFRGNAAAILFSSGSLPTPGGGAIFSSSSSPQIINNLFESNAATNHSYLSQILGGAIYSSDGAPSIINNTFVKNWTALLTFIPDTPTDSGGTLYCDSAAALIANNLVAFNTSGMRFGTGVPQLRNNCTYGNPFFDYQGVNPTGVDGNISIDPKLTGPYADVHLTVGSPCRGVGDPSLVQTNWLDIDRSARLAGGAVDIGADQYDGTTYSFPERIIRVSASGSDTNDGSSWSKAMESVGGAISRAMGEGGEIWVAKGQIKNGTFGVNQVIRIPTFVYVYGGFVGNETNRLQRDWVKNSVILGTPTTSRQVQMLGFGEYSGLSGFTLQDSPYGVIYCYAPFAGEISNNRIINNRSPFGSVAGIYVAGNARIINNVIASNTVYSGFFDRAGIYCDVGSAPLIANNSIVGNKTQGSLRAVGGIFVTNASPKIVNNIIAFNDRGNVVYGQGSNAPVLMNNCVFGSGDSNYVGVLPGLNDISVDPQIHDLPANHALKTGSPCIDTGDNSVVQSGWQDIFGHPRIQGAAVDIGAFESSTAAEWLPLIYSPNVNVTTAGGITYAQYSTVFTNDGYRVASIGLVERAGTNFSQDFKLEWFTGATSPASNVVSGTTVLGALDAGDYSFTTRSWGVSRVTTGFSVPTNVTPTLTMVGASSSGVFQMNVEGVAGVNYIVLTSTNLVDWNGVHTNHGGPFLFTDEVNANEGKRFYRVQIVP